MSIRWDFPLLGTSSVRGTNDAAITMFKGSGDMDGLAREVGQNSLDARRKDLPDGKPVTLKFSLVNIKRDDFDVFAGYERAVAGARAYWDGNPLCNEEIDSFLSNVERAMESEDIPVLVMSDYGTTGLNGVDPALGEKSYWNILVNTEGISAKQDKNSAGSFGIGKNAPFAYSALNMVFYNTYATDGGRAFQGITHLVTTQQVVNGNPRPASDTGKYLWIDDRDEFSWRPILPDDKCPLSNIEPFCREECGTDVAIVGFKKDVYENWEKQIAVAFLKNFILAVIDCKLEAIVESQDLRYVINRESVEDLLFKEFGDDKQLVYTRQIFETIRGGSRRDVKIAEEGDLTIYVRYEDRYLKALSRFRSTGMLINTTSEGSLPHFSVVIVANDVGERKLSETLRAAEPPQHTEWRGKWISDNQKLRNRANGYLRKIRSEVQKVLDEFERADISEVMDAGIGEYLPDAANCAGIGEGDDGLKLDVRINSIDSKGGKPLYRNQFQSAASDSGEWDRSLAVKAGKKKHLKKTNKKIDVVRPGNGDSQGVAPSNGNVRVVTPEAIEHRTFLVAASKYKLHIESRESYENVFIRYGVGREDDGEESLKIRSYKQDGRSIATGPFDQIGPVSLRVGGNDFFIDFVDEGALAVVPSFAMEVCDGC